MAQSTGQSPPGDEEEDDYLTMTFEEPTEKSKKETLTQRKKRLAREAEERARPKSKAQVNEEERLKREAALNTPNVDTQSKAFKMMAALGYKPGTALGAKRDEEQGDDGDTRLLEPIGLEMRDSRSGIGADAEKKRKVREAFEEQENVEKKQKVDEGDFRERQQREREEKKWEGQLWAAMKVAERLDEEGSGSNQKSSSKPLSSVNVLWRGLVRDRAIKERDRRMRYDLHQSLSRLPTYDDPEEEKEDKIVLDRRAVTEEVDLELDQDDAELEEFESLDTKDRLDKILSFMRENWNYCFWCKYQYTDSSMEGCPGTTEEDHD